MAEWIKKLSPKAAEFWEKLSPGRRMAFLTGVALLLGAVILVVSTMNATNYSPLFTGLDPRDAGEIIQTLKDDKVPYKLTDNGSAILVPDDQVYETRINLAAAGMPRGGTVGFELFNQNSLGTTDFERKLKYNWALQGELTRTIREMREVDDARVHIVLPERSLFVEEQKSATASVLLQLKPRATLTEGQVRGITNLISYSVEGLQPENVTVLDSNGNILSESLRYDSSLPISGEVLTAQLKIKESVEQKLEESVGSMLERVFGLGKVVTRVNADLNFDYKESSAEKYSPVIDDTGLLRSEQEYIEEYTGGSGAAVGVPGISSNIPSYQGSDDGESSSQYNKRDITRNYELNKTNEKTITPPGAIKRLTVAVWLDGALPPEQLAQVKAAVEAAVGISAARGDEVTIESMAFERPNLEDFGQPVAAETGADLAQYWPYAVLLLVVVGGVLVIGRRKRSPQKGSNLDVVMEPVEPVSVGELAGEVAESRKVENELRDYARQKPQEAAKLLRTWLMEDES